MFKPEALMICRDKANKNIIDHIKYPFIHCLNLYKKNSLYFKSRDVGYCLIFENKDENQKKKNGNQCYKNLLLLQEQTTSAKKREKIGIL